jgi:hypothetical protein
MTPNFEWQFGGLLRTLPVSAAWMMLAVLGISGAAWIFYSYSKTLRAISPFRRKFLGALRLALLLVILVCLANPVKVDLPDHKSAKPRELAVVVDRSASMEQADNRSETRLDNSLRHWKRHEEAAGEAFDSVKYYQFSTDLQKADSLALAASAGVAGQETHLYAALNGLLETGPAAVVCLTDGLDTTDEKAENLVTKAQRQRIPFYFVAARNRSRPIDYLNIQTVKVPLEVLRQTKFTANLVVEVSSLKDKQLPVSVWQNGEKLADQMLAIRAGWNVLPWSVEISAGEAGELPLEFRVGTGPDQLSAGSTVQVVEKQTIDILHYQGAMQWGVTFFLSALHSDPSFKVNRILSPTLGLKSALLDLPESVEELEKYQIVVLSHPDPKVIPDRTVAALQEYARRGGGILFIASAAEVTKQFAGSPLEVFMPVSFEDPKARPAEDPRLQKFQDDMRALGGANGRQDTLFASRAEKSQRKAPPLIPFQFSKEAKRTMPLPDGQYTPLFYDFAPIRAVKPGAQVIAVHPTETDSDGKTPRVLMAKQQFGEGFSAVLSTDMLWRWKLSLPSSSRAVETFWQQFMLALAPVAKDGLILTKMNGPGKVNSPMAIRMDGGTAQADLAVTAAGPDGRKQDLPVTRNDDHWQVELKPDAEGLWEVSARSTGGSYARLVFPVSGKAITTEMLNLPSDVNGLRCIAQATGGALIEDVPVFQKAAASVSPPAASQVATPLWNSQWIIALLLTVYAVDLMTRRLFELL